MEKRKIMKKNLKTQFLTRQYMLSKDYELYYYSDSHMANVDSHTHDYYEFYFFLEGTVSYLIEKQLYDLKEGDVVVIPPGIHHKAVIRDSEKPYSRFVFWISMDYYERIRQMSEDYFYIIRLATDKGQYVFHNDAVAFSSIQSRIFHLIEEIHWERFGKEEKIFIGICDLFLHLSRMAYEKNHPRKLKEDQNLYENIIQYIDTQLDQDLSLEHLAGKFYVSKYHIAHIFKENTGISIHQYIMKKRLAACQDAILSNISITKAYLMLGFKDYSSFYRAFKKEYGISPKEFRDMKIQLEQQTIKGGKGTS